MPKDLKKQIEDLKNKEIEDDEELEVPEAPKDDKKSKIATRMKKMRDAKKPKEESNQEDTEDKTATLVEGEARILRDPGYAAYYTIIHLQNISSKLDLINKNLKDLLSQVNEE